MDKYEKESKRGTSNLLDELMYSIVVFNIDTFFVLLKEELPNNSTSENLESFRYKKLLLIFRGVKEVVSSYLNISSTVPNRI